MRTARDNVRFFDDLARAATGALGTFDEARKQIKALLREQAEFIMSELDVVTRSEFERVEALAERARTRQGVLEKRIARLEKELKKRKTTVKGKRKK